MRLTDADKKTNSIEVRVVQLEKNMEKMAVNFSKSLSIMERIVTGLEKAAADKPSNPPPSETI